MVVFGAVVTGNVSVVVVVVIIAAVDAGVDLRGLGGSEQRSFRRNLARRFWNQTYKIIIWVMHFELVLSIIRLI